MKHLHIVNNDMIILLKFDLNTFYVRFFFTLGIK